MGLAGAYRQFITAFVDISEPIRAAMTAARANPRRALVLGPAGTTAVETLKEALISSPVPIKLDAIRSFEPTQASTATVPSCSSAPQKTENYTHACTSRGRPKGQKTITFPTKGF